MNDIKQFKHGEEGTHSVCNKHNVGGKSVCCECSGKTDCSDMTHYPSNEEVEKLEAEIMDWHYGVCRINFGAEGYVQDASDLRAILEMGLQQTRLSDLEAIISHVEGMNYYTSQHTHKILISKEDLLSYLNSLKENKKISAIIDKWNVRADMLTNN